MLNVNKKKSITLKNRTNYFNPETTKTKVHFSSPNSYQSRQIKIEGYETRLYWQFRYCEDHNGQTFFYTLTYNDAHLPKHYGINCFDYEDLRDLLTGGFRKQLLRKYGTRFKYFIGAELGDGKGSRGMHNNPHYHVLFFLEPANDERYGYKKISPDDFRHLVRMYWQGFDESRTGFQDYNDALYGIAREGENEGKVTDFRACMYCAKYVCKDAKLKMSEKEVEKKIRFQLLKDYRNSEETYKKFFHEVIYPMYNTPLNSRHTKWLYSDIELMNQLDPLGKRLVIFDCDVIDYQDRVPGLLNEQGLWQRYYEFVDSYIQPMVDEGMSEWRNRYCNKCRISQGVGDYALEFIDDKLNPSIQVPSKKGFKNRPIGMYYYRKLYTDTYVDSRGSTMYILNELGQQYKLTQLPKQLRKMSARASSYIQFISNSKELFDKMKDSDINTEVSISHFRFLEDLNSLLKENKLSEITKRYAEFKLVYEDRFFKYKGFRDSMDDGFPTIDVLGDYSRFLVPTVYSVSRNDLLLDAFLEDIPKDFLPYNAHPYFLRFIGVFRVLDMCADYFFIQKDDKNQQEAESRAATKRFHNQQRLQQFYKQFLN